MKRFRILFILDTPGEGGAQRVAINILKYINRNRFEPELAVFKSEGGYKTMVPEDIIYHNLNVKRTRFSILPLTHLIKKIRPALIFSTLIKVDEAVNFAVKLARNPIKIILRSSNFLSKKLKVEPLRTVFFCRWSYRSSDIIIATTQEMRHDLHYKLNLPLNKIKVIPNPIDLEMVRNLACEPVNDPWFKDNSLRNYKLIITMGRLTEQKGFPYLLNAFKEIRNKIPAKLVILGRGEKKRHLETLARNLDIYKDLKFMGFQTNPYKYIANSDLFVLPSLWEGFPNSIIEAMACGTPVVSTDCLSGPKEIINNGENGLLVPPKDYQALTNGILQILTKKKLARTLTESGFKRVKDFGVKKIVKKYEQLFLSVLENSVV